MLFVVLSLYVNLGFGWTHRGDPDPIHVVPVIECRLVVRGVGGLLPHGAMVSRLGRFVSCSDSVVWGLGV